MILRVSRKNDLVIELTVDNNAIDNISLSYYTDGNYAYTVDGITGNDIITIPSLELERMEIGQLRCKVAYSIKNGIFPDGTKDTVYVLYLELWMQ